MTIEFQSCLRPVLALILAVFLGVACTERNAAEADPAGGSPPIDAKTSLERVTTRLEEFRARPWLFRPEAVERIDYLRQAAGQLAATIDAQSGQLPTEDQKGMVAQLERQIFDPDSIWIRTHNCFDTFDDLQRLSLLLREWLLVLDPAKDRVFEPEQRWRQQFVPRFDDATRSFSQALEQSTNEARGRTLDAALGLAAIAREEGRALVRALEPRVTAIHPYSERWKALEGLATWMADSQEKARAAGSARFEEISDRLQSTLSALREPWDSWRDQRTREETEEPPPSAWQETLNDLERAIDRRELQALSERLGLSPPPSPKR